jgi:ribA/ribD-fused uncharacterized protein
LKAIDSFSDEYRFLSNFWFCKVMLDGVEYPSTEHAFQAAKTLVQAQREEIRAAKTPGQAKRLGKLVELRPDWNQIRVSVMYDLLCQKFKPGNHNSYLLAATYPAINS